MVIPSNSDGSRVCQLILVVSRRRVAGDDLSFAPDIRRTSMRAGRGHIQMRELPLIKHRGAQINSTDGEVEWNNYSRDIHSFEMGFT